MGKKVFFVYFFKQKCLLYWAKSGWKMDNSKEIYQNASLQPVRTCFSFVLISKELEWANFHEMKQASKKPHS